MPWTCEAEGFALANVREDRRRAKSIEKYSISDQAVYYEGRYLPMSCIRSVRLQPSVYRPNHSCGRGIPVYKIRLDFGADRPVVLTIEKKQHAEMAAAMIRKANPDAHFEECEDRFGEKLRYL